MFNDDMDTFEASGADEHIQSWTDEDWEASGRKISNNTDLQIVNITDGALNDHKMSFLFRGWKRSSSIEYLHLDNNQLSPVGVWRMVPFLQYAIRIAKATAETNGISTEHFQAVQCDLASNLLDQLEGKVDVLIFNPPYVPTPDEEVGSSGIEASWAGGKDGRVVIDQALPQIARLLAFPHGVAYVVTVDDNYPEQIAQTMDELYGIRVVPWLRRRAHNEYLTIQRMTPTRPFQKE
jgi:hypothetical protein